MARLTGGDRLLGACFLVLLRPEKAAEREDGDLRCLSVDLDDERPRARARRLTEEADGALLEDVQVLRARFVYRNPERQPAQGRVAAERRGSWALSGRRRSARRGVRNRSRFLLDYVCDRTGHA